MSMSPEATKAEDFAGAAAMRVLRSADGSRDCINVAFDVPLAEVESLLRRNGWTNVRVRNAAYLDGELPILELERPILDELVCFHIRLFRYRGAIVGNAHLDALTLEATPEAVRLHKPFHDVGRDLIVGLSSAADTTWSSRPIVATAT